MTSHDPGLLQTCETQEAQTLARATSGADSQVSGPCTMLCLQGQLVIEPKNPPRLKQVFIKTTFKDIEP